MEKKQTHIMYGFISGVAMVVIAAVLYVTGITMKNEYASYIAQIPFLAGIILNAMAYSKANDGFVTFGNVFGSGFKMSMIVAIVMVAWMIASAFIFPDMKEKILQMSRDNMMARSQRLTEDQIDMSINFMRKYWTVIMVGSAILGTLFFGAIFSLIGGAVAKKNGERPMADHF